MHLRVRPDHLGILAAEPGGATPELDEPARFSLAAREQRGRTTSWEHSATAASTESVLWEVSATTESSRTVSPAPAARVERSDQVDSASLADFFFGSW